MTHEPGRERHMQHRCEHCGGADLVLFYNEGQDEYWCESCLDNEADLAKDYPPDRISTHRLGE